MAGMSDDIEAMPAREKLLRAATIGARCTVEASRAFERRDFAGGAVMTAYAAVSFAVMGRELRGEPVDVESVEASLAAFARGEPEEAARLLGVSKADANAPSPEAAP